MFHHFSAATEEEYYEHIRRVLEFKPHIIIDDGGEFVTMLTEKHPEYAECLYAAVKKRPPAFTSSVHGQRTAHCPSPCLRSMMLIANTFLITATARGKAFGTESCTRQTTW